MATLTIHIKKKVTGKWFTKPTIVLTYNDGNDGGAISRMLQHRGVDETHLLTRHVDSDEYKTEAHPHRIGFTCYTDWDAFLKDERKFTNDENWFKGLEAIREKYPYIINKQTELNLIDNG